MDNGPEESTVFSRPSSADLVEIHVYQVPCDRWIERQNLAKTQVVHYAISSGFVRVPPYITLSDLRTVLRRQLCGETLPEHYVFLRRVGRNFTQVKKLQEKELKVKYYMPPYTFDPEIYIKEGQHTINSRLLIEEDSGVDELPDIQGHKSQDDSTSPSDDSSYNLSGGLPSTLKNNFLSSGGGSRERGGDEMLTKDSRSVAEKSTRCGETVLKRFARRQKISNQLYNSRNGNQQSPASTESSAYLTSRPSEVNNKEKQLKSSSVKTTEEEKFFKVIQESEEEDAPASLLKNIKPYCNTEAESIQGKWTSLAFISRVPTRIPVELNKNKSTRKSVNQNTSSSVSRVPVRIVLLKSPLSRIGRFSCVQEKGKPNSGHGRVNCGRSRHISGKRTPNPGQSRFIFGQKRNHTTHKEENHHNFVENVYKSTNSSGLPRLMGLFQKTNSFSSAYDTSEQIRSASPTQSAVLQFRKQKEITIANKQSNSSTIKTRMNNVCFGNNQLIQYSNTETVALPRKSSKIPKPLCGNITSRKTSFTISRENERETQCWRRFQNIWRQFSETKNFQDQPWPINLTRTIQQECDEGENSHTTNNLPELNKEKKRFINSNANQFLVGITDWKGDDVSSSHTQQSVKDALLKKGYSSPFSTTNDDSKIAQQVESATMINVATLSADKNIKNDIPKQNNEKDWNSCYFKVKRKVTKKGLMKCNRNREIKKQRKSCIEYHTDSQFNHISNKMGGSARSNSLYKASSSNRTLKTEENVQYINGIRTFTPVRELSVEKNTQKETDHAVTSDDKKQSRNDQKDTQRQTDHVVTSDDKKQGRNDQKNKSTVDERITHDNGVEYYSNGALKKKTSSFIDGVPKVEKRISRDVKCHSFNCIVTEEIKENKLAQRHSNRDKVRRYSSKDQIDNQSRQVLVTKTGATNNKSTSRQSTLDVFVNKARPTTENKTRGRVKVGDKYSVKCDESHELIDYVTMGQNSNLENASLNIKDTDEIPRADVNILCGISLIPKPTNDPKREKEDQNSERKTNIASTHVSHDISNIQRKEKEGKEQNGLNVTLENKRSELTQRHLDGGRKRTEEQNYDFEGVSERHNSEALGVATGTSVGNSSCSDSADKTPTNAIRQRVENVESPGYNKSNSTNSIWRELDEQVDQKILSEEDNQENVDGMENKGSKEKIELNNCPSRTTKNSQRGMYEKVREAKCKTEENGKESRETRAYDSQSCVISNNSVNHNEEKARGSIRRTTNFHLRRSRSDSSSLATGGRRDQDRRWNVQ